MATYTSNDIRNIALVGQSGSGKTTLAETLLHHAGAIATRGTVEQGTTVCDFDPQEKLARYSLDSALVGFEHDGRHVNLLDTPGSADFLGRALSVVPAVETMVIVLSANAGVETVSLRMMETAAERQKCRLIVVNKIDAAEGVEQLVEDIREIWGKVCLPLNLPAESGTKVLDCFFAPSSEGADFSSAEEAHQEIVDQVVELDEALMEKYLEGEEMTPEQLHAPFVKALREGHLIPICFVSARTGAGIPELVRVINELMPSPAEANPPLILKGEQQVEVTTKPDRPVVAHVFKVGFDTYAGKLSVFRIFQGKVTSASQLYVNDARRPFKIGHLLKLHGKEQRKIDEAVPGDICAVARVDEISANAILHESHDADDYRMQPLKFPEPMYALALEIKKRGDEQKLSEALSRACEEDPCLRVEQNTEANETIIRGLGELHLRLLREKMKDRYNVEVETRTPSVAYRETITGAARAQYRHKKQTGGAGQFGEVHLRVEPLPPGSGFQFVSEVVGGAIPGQYIPAAEKGVRMVLKTGAIAGYPIQDIKVAVYDGKHHPVDSKEIAFVTAGKKAFIEAFTKAKPIVLEPWVKIHTTVPQENVGDVTGDLASRRGRPSGQAQLPGGRARVDGEVPIAELDDYQSRLKSMTGGAGSYTMEFSHYEKVPEDKQRELMQAFKPVEEE